MRIVPERRVSGPSIDEQTMEILRDRNELDLELYAYAVGLLYERERTYLSSRDSQPVVAERNRFVPFPIPYVPDRKATIQCVLADWLSFGQPELELAVCFQTRVQCEELIVGVGLQDSCGKRVWGTNTLIENMQVTTGNGRPLSRDICTAIRRAGRQIFRVGCGM